AHSFPYAVAIIDHQKPVGIDIEKPRLQLQRIAPKFLNHSEEIAAAQDLTKLCWYWAAKETLYKIYGRKKLIFKKDLAIEPFDPHTDKNVKGEVILGSNTREYTLQFHSHQEFFICYNL
ncbi:MAG: 4'-phosphopantetheinyl transferase family protein, partial [Cyclobacteriaceae bacterium]